MPAALCSFWLLRRVLKRSLEGSGEMARRSDKRGRRAEVKAKRRGSDDGTSVVSSLPPLAEVPAYAELTPTDEQVAAFEDYVSQARATRDVDHEMSLGCVCRLDRGFPAVVCEDSVFRAEFAARLTKGDNSRIAVGDWVCVAEPEGHDMGVIEYILPRKSDIARWKGGSRGEKQTLAANVDVVIVVCALEEWRLSAGRIARSIVVARDCGADVTVVLTKADNTEPEVVRQACGLIREVFGDDIDVAVTAAAGATDTEELEEAARESGASFGIEAVREMVPSGTIAIMLGPSGVGKSTLLNALLGKDALETGAVRAQDGAGRHTTVARRMVSIPGGGIIVDEPGLRTLQLVGHERGMALVFGEITDAAAHCRFRDCTHTHEPGCAVRERFSDDSERLKTYLSLAREMRESAYTLDPDVVL